MTATGWVAFVVAAASGAVLRYLIDLAFGNRPPGGFPWATLLINVTGSFVLGLLTGFGIYHGFPRGSRLVLGTGFCGAYTTFSTFSLETIRLMEEGHAAKAVQNVASSLLLGVGFAAAGLALAAL